MATTYTPVDQDIMSFLEAEKENSSTRVFYFGTGTELKEIEGKVIGLVKKNSYEYYLKFDSGDEIRIDRIISYNLKPGPAYDEYDAYALQCLTCQAGYDF